MLFNKKPKRTKALSLRNVQSLHEKLPRNTAQKVIALLEEQNIIFVISKSRKSKLGDYRMLKRGRLHRISVNEDLDPLQFLITIVHEIAHLHTYLKYRRCAPHGKEWKVTYSNLLREFLPLLELDEKTRKALESHIAKPKSSSSYDDALHERTNKKGRTVKEVQDGEQFYLNRRHFLKKKKLRKRYLCLDLVSKKEYSIHPLAVIDEMLPLPDQK